MANTADFEADRHALPVEDLVEIDRVALVKARAMADAVAGDYARYEFHLVVQRLQTYCSEDLGGFYLDVLKDRLYTAAADSAGRRSAQTALALIRDALLKLMAPILSFTAEEAWSILRPRDPTIFVHTWDGMLPAVAEADALAARWDKIIVIRALVQKELEAVRQAGSIGSSLQADVDIVADADSYPALASLGDDLRFVLITSAARVTRGDILAIVVTPSTHAKCDRCWHWRADVGCDPAHATLCGRCVANLFGAGEPRTFA